MSDKKIMYKTSRYNDKIEAVEVVKLTPCFITYKRDWCGEMAERKESRDGFYDSWLDAHAYLLNRAEEKVRTSRRLLDRANSELGNIKGMKPPVETELQS